MFSIFGHDSRLIRLHQFPPLFLLLFEIAVVLWLIEQSLQSIALLSNCSKSWMLNCCGIAVGIALFQAIDRIS
jgi:hypothetical protein